MRLLTDKSGFGVVYEAYERNLPKILKVLKPRHNSNPKAVELFEQEALALSRLRHPGIPTVEDDGCFQFKPIPDGEMLHCIIMEKIDGPNLSEWMRQQGGNPISERQALDWLRQIADVLHLVHKENFFHRDIKPENIMLRSNGQLVLVDFGAAREMTYTYYEQLGATGGITKVSSAGYTPPEQERGQAVPQSDFYALGCTFIFLLTGRQPTEPAIYDSLDNEFRWRQLAPQVSADIADLIDCMTATRASQRPKSTEDLLNRIVAIAQVSHTRSITTPPHYKQQPSGANESDQMNQANGTSGHPAPSQIYVSPHYENPSAHQHRPWSHEINVPDMQSSTSAVRGHGSQPQAPNNQAQPGNIGGDSPTSALGDDYLNVPSYSEAPPRSSAHMALETLPPDKTAMNPVTVKQAGAAKRKPRMAIALLSAVAIAVGVGFGVWAILERRQSFETTSTDAAEPYILADALSGHTAEVTVLAISPDQQLLASGSHDTQVMLWDLVSREIQLTLSGHSSAVHALAFTPNARYIASGGDDLFITIWDTQTGEAIETLSGHAQSVNDLVFTSDSQRLISASADGTIKIWDWQTGDVVMTLDGHEGFINAIALSPDGRVLVSGAADNVVRLWDLSTGEEIGQLLGHTSFVNSVTISPDGQWIASASADSTVKIWNRITQREIRMLDDHNSYVNALLFSPDGQFLVSSSADQTIKLWKLGTGGLELSIPWPGTFVNAIAVKFEGPTWQVIAGGKGSRDIQIWKLRR